MKNSRKPESEAEREAVTDTPAVPRFDEPEAVVEVPEDPQVDRVAAAVYGATIENGIPWDEMPDAAREQWRRRARQHIAATEAMGR